jgi:hypothetical protein
MIWAAQLTLALLPWIVELHPEMMALMITLSLLGLIMGNFTLFSPGWGKWFPQIRDTHFEDEGLLGKYLIDPLTKKLVGYRYMSYTPDKEVIKYKIVALYLRFSLCSIPKYVAIGIITQSHLPLLGIFLSGLISLVYWAIFESIDDNTELAESEKYSGLYLSCVDILIILLVIMYG